MAVVGAIEGVSASRGSVDGVVASATVELRNRDVTELRLFAGAARMRAGNYSRPVTHLAVSGTFHDARAGSEIVVGAFTDCAAAASLYLVGARGLDDAGAAGTVAVTRVAGGGDHPVGPFAVHGLSEVGSAVVSVNPGGLGAGFAANGLEFELCSAREIDVE